MIHNNEKTSLLIPSQLPEFVRDMPDYQNFVTFLQAYYEWLESSDASNTLSTLTSTNNQGVTYATKNLLDYKDVDQTTQAFLKYFVEDFIPYFPDGTLLDERTAIKVAKQFYGAKGTPATYKLMFRLLYNSDFDIFYTKDVVLKASDGEWYVAKSLKLSTSDTNFLNINNYRLFGETTKSIATIESSVKVGSKIEVFISDIQRLFESGEFVRVVDSNNQDVLVNGQPLRAKILGQVSQIKIDPTRRGLLYQVGDPVVVYGGLNSNTGIGATATVSQTTKGSIKRINVVNGGYGYSLKPNTSILISGPSGAEASVSTLNPDPKLSTTVTLAPKDSISLKRNITIGSANYNFSNIAVSNANTTLINAFTFVSFSTYPISSVSVDNGGGGIETIPTVTAKSGYENDIELLSDLSALGILGPVKILNGGTGYVVNDIITFGGGTGYGAYANVTSVLANGQINTISYVAGTQKYPLGGMGYKLDGLPTLSVVSSNVLAANASVYVDGIIGAGADFSVVVDRAGSVSLISLNETGEDYIAAPSVSLKVQDIIVSNVAISQLPQKGDIVYQGADLNNTTYLATVESITLLSPFNDPKNSLYTFRTFDYNTKPTPTEPLKISGKNISMNVANIQFDSTFDPNGIKNYGDGTAKATASFLNGLVISQGQYLSSRGQPSSYSILQSENYNNYTYQITVEKSISEYRDILLNLIHPTGMKVLGKYALKSNSQFSSTLSSSLGQKHTLGYYTGNPGSYVTMTSDWTNKSNNIINFHALQNANLQSIIFPGDTVELTTADGFSVQSEVVSVFDDQIFSNYIDISDCSATPNNTWYASNSVNSGNNIGWTISSNGITQMNNSVVLRDSVWLTFPNVATVTANSGSNTINITSLTGSYNIINSGVYSNTQYPLKDIVYAGDKVLIANNTERVVQSVNYVLGIITLTSPLTSNSNSLMSVQRTVSTTNVKIGNINGVVYIPQLVTEDGYTITTESDDIILLG